MNESDRKIPCSVWVVTLDGDRVCDYIALCRLGRLAIGENLGRESKDSVTHQVTGRLIKLLRDDAG